MRSGDYLLHDIEECRAERDALSARLKRAEELLNWAAIELAECREEEVRGEIEAFLSEREGGDHG
jgi:hypothetical protein